MLEPVSMRCINMKMFDMKLTPTLRECPDTMASHMQKLFAGEYDIPIAGGGFMILDIGANIGGFALWAHHRWPGSKIVCYEPSQQNYQMLKANLDHYANMDLNHMAVGNVDLNKLYKGTTNCGEASQYQSAPGQSYEDIRVMAPENLPVADILKIDTEGAELDILGPLMKSQRVFTAIMLEYHREKDRRHLDALLNDYTLIGCEAVSIERGTLKYIRSEIIKG